MNTLDMTYPECLRRLAGVENINIATLPLVARLITLINKKYQIFDQDDIIWRGGESILVRAYDKILNRYMAVKIALPEFNLLGTRKVKVHSQKLNDHEVKMFQECRERFLTGITIQDLLSHQLDFGVIPSIYLVSDMPLWVTMQWIEAAQSLDWRQDKDFSSISNLCLKILYVFQKIHKKGVIHRDIKPANIMIDDNGIPAVVDFTMAKFPGATDSITSQGFGLGSAGFSSPVVRNNAREASYCDDVYSLAKTIECLLARENTSEIPAPIRAVLARGYSIDEKTLYKTVKEFADDFRKSLNRAGLVGLWLPDRDVAKITIKQNDPPAPAAITKRLPKEAEKFSFEEFIKLLIKRGGGEIAVDLAKVLKYKEDISWLE